MPVSLDTFHVPIPSLAPMKMPLYIQVFSHGLSQLQQVMLGIRVDWKIGAVSDKCTMGLRGLSRNVEVRHKDRDKFPCPFAPMAVAICARTSSLL
jgi:hypothetical protein